MRWKKRLSCYQVFIVVGREGIGRALMNASKRENEPLMPWLGINRKGQMHRPIYYNFQLSMDAFLRSIYIYIANHNGTFKFQITK